MRIKLFTDTTCDLFPDQLAAMDITALPLHVLLGDVDHLDGVDLKVENLFAYAKSTKTLPKTAAVGMLHFKHAFSQALDGGYDALIYLGLSSKLSGTYQNASLARDELVHAGYMPDRFHILDSLQLSTGSALLLMRAHAGIARGDSLEKILDDLTSTIPRVCTSFVVDTLEFLHMGGRCSSVVYAASSMLRIHPQINMTNGEMSVGDKFHGKLSHCFAQYKKKMVLDALEGIDPERIFITHTLQDEGQARALAEDLRSLHYFSEVLTTRAGATIASHCGPGTMGYLYIRRPDPS